MLGRQRRPNPRNRRLSPRKHRDRKHKKSAKMTTTQCLLQSKLSDPSLTEFPPLTSDSRRGSCLSPPSNHNEPTQVTQPPAAPTTDKPRQQVLGGGSGELLAENKYRTHKTELPPCRSPLKMHTSPAVDIKHDGRKSVGAKQNNEQLTFARKKSQLIKLSGGDRHRLKPFKNLPCSSNNSPTINSSAVKEATLNDVTSEDYSCRRELTGNSTQQGHTVQNPRADSGFTEPHSEVTTVENRSPGNRQSNAIALSGHAAPHIRDASQEHAMHNFHREASFIRPATIEFPEMTIGNPRFRKIVKPLPVSRQNSQVLERQPSITSHTDRHNANLLRLQRHHTGLRLTDHEVTIQIRKNMPILMNNIFAKGLRQIRHYNHSYLTGRRKWLK